MKKSKCKVCGVELPVVAWKRCMLHDGSKRKKPFEKIKPFSYCMGYKISIPFKDFLQAEELVVDNWEIIGWR